MNSLGAAQSPDSDGLEAFATSHLVGYVGGDMMGLVREAVSHALSLGLQAVTIPHLLLAKNLLPLISLKMRI